MMHTLYEIALMAWHVLLLVLKVSAALSVIAVLLTMVAVSFWPEWQRQEDPDPQFAKRLDAWPADGFVSGPAADVTAESWEDHDATRLMVEDACDRLQTGSVSQRFTANRGADHTDIYDVCAREHLRLLDEDPDCYKRT
jgi:hypothetical protein